MISAADNQIFQREWLQLDGHYAFVKPDYMGLLNAALEEQRKLQDKANQQYVEDLKRAGFDVKLTEEQKKELKEDFDPENMSLPEYQSFIDKLCEYGVLKEEDKRYVGYGVKGCGLDLTPVTAVRSGGYLTRGSFYNPKSYTNAFSSSGGSVLDWAKFLAGITTWDEKSHSWQKQPEAILFGKIRDVLEAVSG